MPHNRQLYIYIWQCLMSIVVAVSLQSCGGRTANSELLDYLDEAIDRSEAYDEAKISRIDSLRYLLSVVDTPEGQFELNRQLFLEYESFVCDSAMHYINANIDYARSAGDNGKLMMSLVEKADLVAKAGIFTEALNILSKIDAKTLPDSLKDNYYQICGTTYQYMNEYAEGSEYVDAYNIKIAAYRDSVLSMSTADPFIYDTEYGSWLIGQGKLDEAIVFFTDKLDNYQFGTREYSVVASLLAYVYQLSDSEQYEHFLVLSAISDIQGSVKENLALRSLAELRFENGDVPHAYHYLKKSMEDANYFSARMRKNQSANALPLVIQSYEALQKQMQSQLKTYIIVIGALAVGLIVAVLFIVKQLRTVSRSLRYVSVTKDKLLKLNEELQQANATLKQINTALIESSCIKEEYIGKFMELCSKYISTLEQYRKMLYQQAASGRADELHKSLRSTSIVNETLKEFYSAFDTAFLNIFPDFVERFNDLLPQDDHIQLKEGEKLNTELRVFALIRLGITDSAKIAGFLRCSITTIYTYRSKRKKRSLCPVDFDDQVMKIASF